MKALRNRTDCGFSFRKVTANSVGGVAVLPLFLAAVAAMGAPAQAPKGDQSSGSRNELLRERAVNEVKLLNEPLTATERKSLIQNIQNLSKTLARTNGMAPPDGPPILPVLMNAIQISSDFKHTADEIATPFDATLETYDKLAQAVTGGEKPPKPTTPYSIDGFAAQIETAAETLDVATAAPVIDASQYSVSLQQLASCVTQDGALSTLHSYADAMDQAIASAQTNLDYLNALRQTVSQLNSDAQIFAKAAAIGASTPDLDWLGYFSSAWWDLDQHLSPAIAHLNNAVTKQIQSITTNKQRIETQDANLKSNLQLLQPNWCILGGNWSGQSVMDQFGLKAQASLSLTNNGTQDGTFTYNNTPMQPRSVSLTGRVNLTVTLGGSTLQGTFDSKYQQFVGKLIFPGSPGLTSTVRLTGSGY
jgi:hypothetical protein